MTAQAGSHDNHLKLHFPSKNAGISVAIDIY